jgi:hypothetical protein
MPRQSQFQFMIFVIIIKLFELLDSEVNLISLAADFDFLISCIEVCHGILSD